MTQLEKEIKMNEHKFCETYDGIKNDMKQLKEESKLFKSRYIQIAKATKKLYNYGDEHMYIGTEAGYKPKHKRVPKIMISLFSIWDFKYKIKELESYLKKF
jgi:hypothetical protein